MTTEQLFALVFAGGLGGLITAISTSVINAFKERATARREDRKQVVDEKVALINGVKTLVDATGSVVKLQDDQAADLLKQIDTLRTELQQVREQARVEREQTAQDHEKVQARLVEAENRLARAERRAGEAEKQANEFRTDVIRLGEELVQERKSNAEKIAELKREHQATINKLVIIIESLFKQLKGAGVTPDIDLDDLKKMYVIEKAAA